MVAFSIQLEGDTGVVAVMVGRSEGGAWMWGRGNSNMVHEFRKVGDGAEAQGVVGAESHAGSHGRLPV